MIVAVFAAATAFSAQGTRLNRNSRKIKSKKPEATAPGFLIRVNARALARSGRRLEQLGGARLDRLDGLGRNLLAQFGEFLAVGRKGLELLLGVSGPQIQRFRR